jgi:phosphoglucosamine mutase
MISGKISRFAFGTDGIRSIFGKSPLVPQEIWAIGYGIGQFLKQEKAFPYVILGHDTRYSCQSIEHNLCAGLAESGIYVESVGIASTPMVSFLTTAVRADLGIVISASHNSFEYNGIKIFNAKGEKLSFPQERSLQQYIQHAPEKIASLKPVSRSYTHLYEDFICNFGISLKGMRLVLDSAHGALSGLAGKIFKRCGAQVLCELGNAPDGYNINAQAGSLYPNFLCQAVNQYKADLGIAFDGDGDRVILVCDKGQILDGDQIIACLAQRSAMPCSGVVGTVMSGLGLEKFLAKQNIAFERTSVGDRYIAEKLREFNWDLGAEPCGHVIIRSLLPTGDGLIAALLIADYIKNYGNPFPLFPSFPSVLKNFSLVFPVLL